MALLEKFQALMDVAFDPQNQCFQVEGVLRLVTVFFLKELVDELEALGVLLSYEEDMHQPVRLLTLVQGMLVLVSNYGPTVDRHLPSFGRLRGGGLR